MKKFLEQNKLTVFMAIYGLFYLIAFGCLENRDVRVHIIHTKFDEIIPFCEYFIIPYVFLFVYMIGTILYFLFQSKDEKECKGYIYSLCAGMGVFLLVSLLYPNGHDLRPELSGNGFFIWCVKLLHRLDTATNILPSLHVFGTVVCSAALLRQQELRKKKGFVPFIYICSVLIVLSTMFLKQHSIVDVVTALVLNCACYKVFYNIDFEELEEKRRCGRRKFLQSPTF